MGVKSKIIGVGLDGKKIPVQMYVKSASERKGKLAGLVTYQERLKDFDTQIIPFFNLTYGLDMAVAPPTGGTPVVIDDGAAGGWNTTAVQGSWDFADAGRTSITNANNNDEALFTKPSGVIDMSGYVAISGDINLDTYSPILNTIVLEFRESGTIVGNTINLNTYIDPTDIGTTQLFSIPKADFGLEDQDVDELRIVITRSGGVKPTLSFDNLQIEDVGVGVRFDLALPPSSVFHVDTIRFNLAGPLTGVYPNNLSYDKILNLSALAIGLTLIREQKGEVQFAIPLKQLSDFIQSGANIVNGFSDGTNTFITLEVKPTEELFIIHSTDNDSVSMTVNDDMSGLDILNASLVGRLEITHN